MWWSYLCRDCSRGYVQQHIQINGNSVKAINGATFLAAFNHPNFTLSCSVCPSTTANNSITVCSSTASGGSRDTPP